MCITTRHAYDACRSRKMSDSSPKNMIITLGLMISTKSPVSCLRQTLHHQDRSTDSCIGVIEVETVRHQCRSVRKTLRHWCRTVRTLRHRFDSAEMSWVRSVLGPKCLDTKTLTSRVHLQPPRYVLYYAKRLQSSTNKQLEA